MRSSSAGKTSACKSASDSLRALLCCSTDSPSRPIRHLCPSLRRAACLRIRLAGVMVTCQMAGNKTDVAPSIAGCRNPSLQLLDYKLICDIRPPPRLAPAGDSVSASGTCTRFTTHPRMHSGQAQSFFLVVTRKTSSWCATPGCWLLSCGLLRRRSKLVGINDQENGFGL